MHHMTPSAVHSLHIQQWETPPVTQEESGWLVFAGISYTSKVEKEFALERDQKDSRYDSTTKKVLFIN
jgi:hypothetical protein